MRLAAILPFMHCGLYVDSIIWWGWKVVPVKDMNNIADDWWLWHAVWINGSVSDWKHSEISFHTIEKISDCYGYTRQGFSPNI